MFTKFNFGTNFINWIKILYTEPQLVIKNNGYFSKKIKLSRGLRQGCPISALLFILVVEVLAVKIKNNKSIKGFQFNTHKVKISQYADDMMLILSDINSVTHGLSKIEEFTKAAGPKLNFSKTEGLLIGSLRNSTLKTYSGISLSNECLKCLGIYVGNNKEKCMELNWNDKIRKMKNILKIWEKRPLTIFGKVVLVNTLCLSKIINNCLILPVPENIIKCVDSIIMQFLFKKRQRINRKCLINSIENGGIGVVDIHSKIMALKASWVCRWLKKPLWTMIANTFLGNVGCTYEMLLCMNINNRMEFPQIEQLPEFYQDVWMSFHLCKPKKEINNLTTFDFLSSIIWGNNIFKFKNKCLYYDNWIKAGIIYARDLFNLNGNFLSGEQIFHLLPDKRKWMSEYSIIKKVFKPHTKTFNTLNAYHINIHCNTLFFNGQKMVELKTAKSKLFYEIGVKMIATRHYMEKCWNVTFGHKYLHCEWKNIYLRKIKNIPCKKISEFNYKILHNLLVTGYILSKWNKNIPPECLSCGAIDTPEHLLFQCNRVKTIWNKVGTLLKVDLSWKHIVIGLHEEGEKDINTVRNNILSIIAYSIYISWVKCDDSKCTYKFVNIDKNVKNYLNHYCYMYNIILVKKPWKKGFDDTCHTLLTIW